jgi:hypothetical protein
MRTILLPPPWCAINRTIERFSLKTPPDDPVKCASASGVKVLVEEAQADGVWAFYAMKAREWALDE